MVFDVLAWFASREAGSFLAKEVLLPLLKGSCEDYTKDFFKDCISDAIGLASKEPVQKATTEALTAFVDSVQDTLEDLGLTGAEIRDFYEVPLRKFIKEEAVRSILSQAFDPDIRSIDSDALDHCWTTPPYPELPEEFDWSAIAQSYRRDVRRIMRSSDKLRELLVLHNQEAMRQGIEELVGIPPDFDLRKYQETLREQYGNLKLESLDTTGYAYNELKLWRMFIPQDVRTCQEFNPKVYEIPKEKLKELQRQGELDVEMLEAAQLETYRQTYVEQPIQNVLEVVGRTAGVGTRTRPVADYAVVLGDPGSGKSTLLQYIALQWAEQPIRDLKELAQRPLPLLIELRKYARDRHDQKCSSIVEYLHQGDIACRLNQQRLHDVLTEGNAVALFDGIDEVFNPDLREVVVTDIHRFTNNYPHVQTVVTSRWLGYKAQTLRDAGFQHYMLQDLTDEQISEFIQRWHDQTFPEGADKVRKGDRLHKAIRESKAIRELAGNPLLLTMMAILNRNQELPRDRPELYNQASRVLLHQWDVERNLIEQKLDPVTIDYADKQAMLRKVADHMQSGDAGLAGNIISAQDLEAILTDYLKSIDVEQPRYIARRMIRQLRERNFILCYRGADIYSFIHRTFLEYFCAVEIVHRFEKERNLTFEQLRDEIFEKNWQDETWHEVLCLICGMIDVLFSSRIIESIASKRINEEAIEKKTGRYSQISILSKDSIASFSLAFRYILELKIIPEATKTTIISRLKEACESVLTEIEGSKNHHIFGRQASDSISEMISYFDFNDETLAWLKNKIDEDDSKFSYGWQSTSSRDSESPIYETIFSSLTCSFIRKIVEKRACSSDTFAWLKGIIQDSHNSITRGAAIQELARNYSSNSETLSIIQKCILEDTDEMVRRAALQELYFQWPDRSETISLIKRRAKEDVGYARAASLECLSDSLIEENEAFPIFLSYINCHKSRSDFYARATVIRCLMCKWEEHPQTLEIISQLSQEDEHDFVRTNAIEALSVLLNKRPDILGVFFDIAAQDNFVRQLEWQNNPRQIALNVLVQQCPDHPKTLELLRDRAQNDNDEQLREWAAEQLEQLKIQN